LKKRWKSLVIGLIVGAITGFITYYLNAYVIASVPYDFRGVSDEFQAVVLKKSLLFGLIPGAIVGVLTIIYFVEDNIAEETFVIPIVVSLVVVIIAFLSLFHYPASEYALKNRHVVLPLAAAFMIACVLSVGAQGIVLLVIKIQKKRKGY
jgi:putative effector of murein hydrolase